MKMRLACILGILALTFSVAASAQTQPVQRGVETSITGTVVSSTPTSLVIRDANGAETTFDVDTSSGVPSGLASGSRVTVRFHDMDGGRRHAASVTTSDVDTTATTPTPSAPTEPTTFAPTAPTPIADPVLPIADPAPSVRVAAPAPLPASDAPAGERLPDTASEMPLLALAGLMTLGAGLVLRELRRRDA
jgi:hypothetical protein